MNRFIKSGYNPAFLVFFLMPLLFSSCKDDENPQPDTDPDNPYDETNAWIYSVMDEVSLYTEFLKEEDELDDTLEPLEYFNALKYSGDRFSILYPAQTLVDLLEGIQEESGYEFQAVTRGSDGVVALIKYVKRNSPAQEAGLKRGDLISAVNGQGITLDNYQNLLPQIFSNHTATYERFNETSELYEVIGDVELNVLELEENPNLFDSVYTFNDKKIGYFFYNAFIDGPGDTENYNIEMDNIFASFKGEGITDLVLDLRYNSGGSTLAATNLASLAGDEITTSDVFFYREWNELYQDYWLRQDITSQLQSNFLDKSENVGNDLSTSTVYVLIGNQSASASEMIINGLTPYMNVVIIGSTTAGKNVGSVFIADDNDEYAMLPITFFVQNSLREMDYAAGFTPSGDLLINEFDFRWYPVGDVRDPLLGKALEEITGEIQGSSGGRMDRTSGFHLIPFNSVKDIVLPVIDTLVELPELN